MFSLFIFEIYFSLFQDLSEIIHSINKFKTESFLEVISNRTLNILNIYMLFNMIKTEKNLFMICNPKI